GARDELTDMPGCQVIEEGKRGVEYEQRGQDVVDCHHVAEREGAEEIRPMNHKTCQEQEDDCHNL
ncbi:MAG: hypothetical protein ACK8QZ_05650, partial [Anaerolineales bacterium]